MALIRCTGKLITEMGLKKTDLFQGEVPQTGLGDWYANLFKLSQYKCIIFTNALTLFSLFYFGAKKKDIQNLSELFQDELYAALVYEQFPDLAIGSIMQNYGQIQYAPTSNKQVLGSMTDFVRCYEHCLSYVGEINLDTLTEINAKMNRMPMKAIGYNYPIEEFKKALVFRA